MTANQEKKRRGRPPKSGYAETKRPKKKMPTKRVFICSPLAGAIERNMKRAEIYCQFAFDKGFVPIAPHIYFPRFLNDDDKNERAAGQRYGLEMMWLCSQLWVGDSKRGGKGSSRRERSVGSYKRGGNKGDGGRADECKRYSGGNDKDANSRVRACRIYTY